jgi:transposase
MPQLTRATVVFNPAAAPHAFERFGQVWTLLDILVWAAPFEDCLPSPRTAFLNHPISPIVTESLALWGWEVSTKPVMDTGAIKRRRHRSWPEALKLEIVAASFAPGSSVSVVARQYDVNANPVFSWRKRYRDARPVPSDPSASRLMPVVITAETVLAAGCVGISGNLPWEGCARHPWALPLW